jgi:hypothetical protein
MTREPPVTAVQRALHRRWLIATPLWLLFAVVLALGIVATLFAIVVLWQLAQNRTPHYSDVVEHFK